jgi:hypothetical protein
MTTLQTKVLCCRTKLSKCPLCQSGSKIDTNQRITRIVRQLIGALCNEPLHPRADDHLVKLYFDERSLAFFLVIMAVCSSELTSYFGKSAIKQKTQKSQIKSIN